MSENGNAFSHFDFSLDDALEANDSLAQRGPRDQRVCLCGHAVSRHTEIAGIAMCKPSKMECSCKKMRPVLRVTDLRVFLRKTDGSGPMHALGRGMATAVARGVGIEWLVEAKCDRCGAEGPMSPVAVTQAGHAASHDTGYNALLCGECRTQI